MTAEPIEKIKLNEILYHYSHCLTAMDDVKTLIVTKHETEAINKLRDIKENLEIVGNWLKEMNDEMV